MIKQLFLPEDYLARRPAPKRPRKPRLETLEDRKLLSWGLDTAGFAAPDGFVAPYFSTGSHATQAFALAFQNDKILLAGSSDGGRTWIDFTVARHNANGTLDTTFGSDQTGVVRVDYARMPDTAYKVLVYPSEAGANAGKILLVGVASVNSSNHVTAVTRLHANGTLDTSFGRKGWAYCNPVSTATWALEHYVEDVAFDSQYRLVVAGGGFNQPSKSGLSMYHYNLITRFTTNGALDSTFGKNGTAVGPNLTSMSERWKGLSVRADDSIDVVGGNAGQAVIEHLDASGKNPTWIPSAGTGVFRMMAGPSKIVSTQCSASETVQVSQIDAGLGTLDPTFGDGGTTVVNLSTYFTEHAGTTACPELTPGRMYQAKAYIYATSARNDILLGGNVYLKDITDGPSTTTVQVYALLVRLGPDGQIDTGFGVDGVLAAEFAPVGTSNTQTFYAMLVQPDGATLAAGRKYFGSELHALLARYIPDAGAAAPASETFTQAVPAAVATGPRAAAPSSEGSVSTATVARTRQKQALMMIHTLKTATQRRLQSPARLRLRRMA